MCQLRLFQYNTIRRLSTLRLPLTFYQVPYDEQYESRDFIRKKPIIISSIMKVPYEEQYEQRDFIKEKNEK